MKRRLAVISVYVFFRFTALSQNWIIYNTTNSGLPANEVLCIAQDQQNHKWIGTYWGGVARFTNTQWTVYTDTNSAMPHYTVRAIAVDNNNDKWFGTPSGLAKFNGNDFTIYNSSNTPLPSNFINLIRVDGNNNKWIGTNQGLAKFDGQNWEVFTTSNSGLPNNYIQSLEIGLNTNQETVLWLGTYGGLVRFEPHNNSWTVFNSSNSSLEDDIIYGIGITQNNKIWVRTFSEIARYNGNNWHVYDQYSLGQPNSFCRTLPTTDSNSLWVGGNEGLVKLQLNQGNINNVEYFNSLNSGLPNNGVLTLFSDHNKNLWIGVSLGNLVVYNPNGVNLVPIFENELTSRNSLFPNPVSDMAVFDFELMENEQIHFEWFDATGKKVLGDITENFQAGNNRITFNVNALVPGIYFLKMQTPDGRTSFTKFIISR